MINILRHVAQMGLFAALLPVYTFAYIHLWNYSHNMVYPLEGSFGVAVSHWRYLDFPRLSEPVFAISATTTTVILVTFLARRWLAW